MTVVVHPENRIVDGDGIRSRRPKVEVVEPDGVDALPEVLADADPAVFLCIPSLWEDRFLQGLEEGDWVVTMGAGYEGYPTDRFEQRRITLTNTPGIGAPPVAEHVFGLVFAFTRRLLSYREQQHDGVWRRLEDDATDLAGDVCCVVGLGNVGEAVAERANAFGMTVRGVKRSTGRYDGVADEVFAADRLRTALAGSDLVVVAVPLTDETAGLIGQCELRACADDAIVVNVARGPVVETDALLDALNDDRIRSAGLDVFDEEPLPESSPLWDHPRVLVTPHTAWITDKYTERFLNVFFEQLDRWRSGESLAHRIC